VARLEGRGFSLIEALIVLSVGAILASVAAPTIFDAVRNFRADASQQTVLMQLRLARSLAVDQRRIHRVTFSGNGIMRLSRLEDGAAVDLGNAELGSGVAFELEPGVPVEGDDAPDAFDATSAIDLNDGTSVWFRPDGSAVDGAGNPCNGVIHLAVPGVPSTARAITVFGATGRIRSWRFETASQGGGSWK